MTKPTHIYKIKPKKTNSNSTKPNFNFNSTKPNLQNQTYQTNPKFPKGQKQSAKFNLACPELGTAQPQLVFFIFNQPSGL